MLLWKINGCVTHCKERIGAFDRSGADALPATQFSLMFRKERLAITRPQATQTQLHASGIADETFELEIGGVEKSKLEFSRNWFTGATMTLVNGRVGVLSAGL